MAISKKEFGTLSNGKTASLYTITNENGASLDVTNYGAIWVGTKIKTLSETIDVVLGFDDVSGYEQDGAHLGATVGRNANRIKEGKYTLAGNNYSLDCNSNGNNLHSGPNYWGKRLWDTTTDESSNSVTFHLFSNDMEQGYPGDLDISITYTLTADNTVELFYKASSNQTTIFNPTNHVYFNLNGPGRGDVFNHLLKVDSDYITETDNDVSTGKLLAVKSTPFDYTSEKTVSIELDTNFCKMSHHTPNTVRTTCVSLESGIQLEVSTDLPGIQIYTGNYLDEDNGKSHSIYRKGSGICFETQYYVNAINIDSKDFMKPILEKDKVFTSTSRYHFSIRTR